MKWVVSALMPSSGGTLARVHVHSARGVVAIWGDFRDSEGSYRGTSCHMTKNISELFQLQPLYDIVACHC